MDQRSAFARRILLSSLALFAVGIALPAGAQTGPVGYWKLDEGTGTTTADSSGNGATATLGTGTTWVTGRVGPYALSFPVSTAYATANGGGALANLQNSGLTVSAWIKPASAGGGGKARIVDKDDNNVGWFFAMNSTASLVFTADNFTTVPTRISTNALTLNTWQHVLVTWDGTTNANNIHFYVNGVSKDSTATSGSGTPTSDAAVALTIGNRPTDQLRRFDGPIDEVRVYNRILSAAEITALADSTAPSAPNGLSATAASSSQINLSWTASTDNVGVTGYRVERCTGSGCSNFTQVATPTGTSYSDTGLSGSTSYSYRVRATDANSNLSGYSNTASATTPAGGDTQPPTAPSGLTATATSSSQISLSWTASTDNVGVTGYLIERCAGASCSNFLQIGTATSTSFNDAGLAGATSYSYRVRATDAANNLSGYSNTATATTPTDTQPPTTPTGLFVVNGTSTEIDLAWTASTDNVGVAAYLVERCQGDGCSNFAQIGAPAGPSYNDIGLLANTSYSYRVRAKDAANNLSPYSAILSVVTPYGTGTCHP